MMVYRVRHKESGKFWRGGRYIENLGWSHTYSARSKGITPTPLRCWVLNTFSKDGKVWLQAHHLKKTLKQLPKEVLDVIEIIAYHLKDEVHNTFAPADILADKALAK